MSNRRIFDLLKEDLDRKMVLLTGPRQCGKTTIAKDVGKGFEKFLYLNWDIKRDRSLIRNQQLDEGAKFWCFDELHKLQNWRGWLKGVYDEFHDDHSILVTGSARLDLFRRKAGGKSSGDSLQGRYFLHHLHPFTLSEYTGHKNDHLAESIEQLPALPTVPNSSDQEALNTLLLRGGFPEPLFADSDKISRRWKLLYSELLLEQDLRELERFVEVDNVALLFERLPEVIGSPLSLHRLSLDLEVTQPSINRWISAFENLYYCHRVAPYGLARIRAIKKGAKLYLWDWSRVEAPGARLENLLLIHLLRLEHWCHDILGEKIEIRYFRDSYDHEVDFLILKNKQPWIAIEVKSSEQELDTGLRYFLERVRVPYAFQLHLKSGKEYRIPSINGCKIRSVPLVKFLANLP